MRDTPFVSLVIASTAVGVLFACGIRFAIRRAAASLAQGRPERALRWLTVIRLLPVSDFKFFIAYVETAAYNKQGLYVRAAHSARRMLIGGPSSVQSWELINLAVCSLVTAGLYQEVLHDAWPTDSLEKAESKDRHGIGIVQINRAEALHNLGRDTEAHALLDKVEHLVVDYPLALHGLRCLRAWIHVHEGELEKARSILANVDHVALAPDYAAEVEYTWAALEREAGSYAKAQGHAAKGLDLSVRTSSKRNGLFMLASIAAQSGDAPAAMQWFEQAMAHPYKGQSRYGLLRFAAFLRQHGDTHRAAQVTKLSSELDPESALRERTP